MKIHTIGYILCFWLLLSGCDSDKGLHGIWYIEIQPRGGIHVLDPKDGQDRVVIPTNEFVHYAGISPNGKHLAYLTFVGETPILTAWLANIDGSNPTKIASDLEQADFVWLDDQHLAIATLWDDYPAHPENPFQWKEYDLATHTLSPLSNPDALYAPRSFRHTNDQARILNGLTKDPAIGYGHWQVVNHVLHYVMDFQVDPDQTPPKVTDGQFLSTARNGQFIAFSGEGGSSNKDVFLATNKGQSVRAESDPLWGTVWTIFGG